MNKEVWIVEKREVEDGVSVYTSLEVYLDEKKAWDRCTELSMQIKFDEWGHSDEFYGLVGPLPLKE
jgi:hypothetical protein